jgi:MFS family permease
MAAAHLSFAGIGLLGTAYGVARLALDLPAGALADRFGPTAMMHTGLAASLAGTLVTATASSLPALMAGRALAGVGTGMTMVVGIMYLMRSGVPEQRTRRNNMLEGALITGQAVSGYLAGAISVRAGWRWGFGLAALAVAASWLIAATRVLPAVRAVVPRAPAAAAPATARPAGPAAPISTLLAIYLATFTLSFGWSGGIATLAPLYGGQALGLTPAAIGGTMAIAYAVEAALLVPVGWAADTLGRLRILVPGFGLLLAGIVLVPLSRGVTTYTLACTLIIVGMTVWMIPPALLADRLAGRVGGRVVGLYRFTADLSMVVAPVGVGWLIEHGGFGVAAGVIAAVVAAAATLVVAVLAPPRGWRSHR